MDDFVSDRMMKSGRYTGSWPPRRVVALLEDLHAKVQALMEAVIATDTELRSEIQACDELSRGTENLKLALRELGIDVGQLKAGVRQQSAGIRPVNFKAD